MKFPIAIALILTCVSAAYGQDRSPLTGKISLTQIDGRYWLVDAKGNPFFAHGITHVNNQQAKLDFVQFATVCRKLGFNAYGYGCPERLRGDMPYIESWNHLVPISTYRGKKAKFIDIFDPDEQARLEKGVRNYCFRNKKHTEKLIGYCWTDLAAWPLENATGSNWVEFIRSLPKDSAGQKTYEKFLSEFKGDKEDETARDMAFLRLIAREYFRVVGETNRKCDPDRLIFGDRFAFHTYEPTVLEEMLPWVDAIAIQPHFWAPFPKQELDEIYKLSGKPILLCDFAIRFKDGDKDVRMWKMAEDSMEAGKQYTDYIKAAMETDYILGVFWCNPVDTPKGFGKPGVKQGFFADGLAVRPGLHAAVKKLNEHRIEITPTKAPSRQ